ncbi:MAG: hypothetical protein CBD58_03900 [bacterium TMED198]|nr:MAG: hypothetical protein CBD58_03900 [bacterium TMED198]|tara:strand:+ start:5376 stop:6083 length:708 start_codon:yes stop_codon:yes gene_type:complete
MIKTIYFILFFFLINCNRSNRSSIDINGHVFIKFDSKTHISKYEVSNSQFAKYLNSAFKEGKIRVDSMSRFLSYYGGDRYYKKGEKEIIQIIDNEASIVYHKDSGFKVLDGKDNLPVINITWFGAYNYCQYYGLKLPSENQWLEITKNIIEVDSFYTIKNSFLAVDSTRIGVFNLNSNVSEWIDTFYDERSPFKQIRGSSFKNKLATPSKKLGNFATLRTLDLGFRPIYISNSLP